MFEFIMVIILGLSALAIMFHVDTKLLKRTKKKSVTTGPVCTEIATGKVVPCEQVTNSWKLNPDDYSWGDPEIPKLLADTTWSKLEKQWEIEHPTEEQRLRALLEKKSGRIITLELEVENLKRYTDRFSSSYSPYKTLPPGTIVNTPKDITEEEFQKFVKKWAVQLAESVKNPGSIITVPQMKVMTAAPIKARVVEWSTDNYSGELYGLDGKTIDSYSIRTDGTINYTWPWDTAVNHVAMDNGGMIQLKENEEQWD